MENSLININWEEFHFLRPVFLWLILPLLVALVFGLITINRQIKWQKHIAPHLRSFVITKGSEQKLRWIRILTVAVFLLAILGLAGPTWKKIQVPGKILETPVVIVLDISQSMMATDIQPTRLERAKFKIHDFLQANPHARVALIGFAGTAHIVVPLTSDYTIIQNHLDGLSPDIMPVPGSNLEAALQLTDTITQISDAPGRLILFTDDFTNETTELLRNYANNGTISVEIMPMNTTAGADIYPPNSKVPFKDKQGNTVHSTLNRDALDQLNSLEKTTVNTLTLDKSDVELIAKKVGANLKFQEQEEEKQDDWVDRGLFLIIPFVLLVLFWFRKGWVIFSFIVLVSLSSCNTNNSFKDLWFTKAFQAQQKYNNGNYTEAAELFADPMRKGVAWFKAGEYEKAIEAFEADTTAQGKYNLGLAYYKNGDYAGAALAFGEAAEINPELKDAMKNKELMQQFVAGIDETTPQEAQEASDKPQKQNIENKDMEDLGGGGQEATEKDMERERKEETAETGMRKGKELEDVPDNFESGNSEPSDNVVMQRIDDDPALFLKRKFRYQLKKGIVEKPTNNDIKW